MRMDYGTWNSLAVHTGALEGGAYRRSRPWNGDGLRESQGRGEDRRSPPPIHEPKRKVTRYTPERTYWDDWRRLQIRSIFANQGGVGPSIRCWNERSESWGVRMYRRKESLDHRPMTWMT